MLQTPTRLSPKNKVFYCGYHEIADGLLSIFGELREE